jgi:hypothetical protein
LGGVVGEGVGVGLADADGLGAGCGPGTAAGTTTKLPEAVEVSDPDFSVTRTPWCPSF